MHSGALGSKGRSKSPPKNKSRMVLGSKKPVFKAT